MLATTVGRTIPYPKIFLRRPKNKAGTYSIKEWTDHRKLKIAAMTELSKLTDMHLFLLDCDVN